VYLLKCQAILRRSIERFQAKVLQRKSFLVDFVYSKYNFLTRQSTKFPALSTAAGPNGGFHPA